MTHKPKHHHAKVLRWLAEMFRTGKPIGNGAGNPSVLAALAAASQPPEAAPVQLPEPVAWRDPNNILPSQGCTYEKSTAKKWAHIYTEPLYTEHQVRQLLATHGIK